MDCFYFIIPEPFGRSGIPVFLTLKFALLLFFCPGCPKKVTNGYNRHPDKKSFIMTCSFNPIASKKKDP